MARRREQEAAPPENDNATPQQLTLPLTEREADQPEKPGKPAVAECAASPQPAYDETALRLANIEASLAQILRLLQRRKRTARQRASTSAERAYDRAAASGVVPTELQRARARHFLKGR